MGKTKTSLQKLEHFFIENAKEGILLSSLDLKNIAKKKGWSVKYKALRAIRSTYWATAVRRNVRLRPTIHQVCMKL